MNTRGAWITLLFMACWTLSAASRADEEPSRPSSQEMEPAVWNGEFKLADVKKTSFVEMLTLALPSERAKVATFFGYRSEDLCGYLASDVGKKIADWDLRFVATANMDAKQSAFEAKSLINSTDEVPLVSTVTDKCQELNKGTPPMLIVTNHFVPGKDAEFALWTDNPSVWKELGAGWVDLGDQSDGEWIQKNFDWDEAKAKPEVGDTVEVTQRSHIYADHVRYREELDLWVEGPIVTVLHSGDRYHVEAVKELRGGSVWAKISPTADLQ